MRRLARHVAGWFFILLGIAGFVLPILQGWLFVAIGAILLAPDVPLFARLVCWVEDRFPRLRGALRKMRSRLHRDGEPPPPCPPDADPPASE